MKVCISHMEDADGIVSACMISKMFNTKNILVDYDTLLPNLKKLVDEDIKELFICDLGLGKAIQDEFLSIIKELRGRGVNITYIDHHDQSDALKDALNNNLRLIHTLDECTSVIIYSNFKDKLDDRYKLLAAAAAIVDEMDRKPIASKLVKSYDRQFIFYETTVLSYAIYASQNDMPFLLELTEELKHKLPHEIDGLIERANRYAEQVASTMKLIEEQANIRDGFGLIYIKDPLDTGATANMLLMMKQLKVGMAYKDRDDRYVISLRGAEDYDKHLGRILSSLASELGGSGGGHKLACGASIPKDKMDEFINRLEQMIK
ncbi:MAG: single-stranded DNA exonuclease RecJ [Candidatus Nitrosothermus koennekii]|nr:MAG: single-stranded DNA exonuclease RecJ [Candidatus Nitrosothermus koennekii]